MKKLTFVLAAAFLVFALAACGSSPNSQATDAAHNARNSVNWAGVYTGTIPAASAPGIDVQLTLNADETYEIRYDYIDREGDLTEKGTFTWDSAGSVITLDTRDMPPHYKVGENTLTQLDMEGKPITGNLAENYVLRKNQ